MIEWLKYGAILGLVVFGLTLFNSGITGFQAELPHSIQVSRTLESYGLPTIEQMRSRLPADLNSFIKDFMDTAPQAMTVGGKDKVGYAGVGGVALVLIGIMAFIIGWFTLIAASFMTHFLWGMASLALPGFGYVFALSHLDFDVTKKGVLVSAFGLFVGFCGAVLTVVAI